MIFVCAKLRQIQPIDTSTVQRKKLRKSLERVERVERVDPIVKVLPPLRTLRRRAYNKSTLNALW